MAKKVGITAVILGMLTVFLGLVLLTFNAARGSDDKVTDMDRVVDMVKIDVKVNETKIEAIKSELAYIRAKQELMDAKLDTTKKDIISAIEKMKERGQ